MADSSKLGALTKEVQVSPLAAPGPMLGGNGFLNPRFVLDDELQQALNDVVKKTLKVKDDDESYAFAVVDLTDNPKAPAYAGWNDRKQLFVASMAKLLPIYAAFQLRADLRALSSQTGFTDLTKLANEAHQRYKSIYAVKENLPRIDETTFTLDSSGKVDFTSGPKTDAQLASAHNSRTAVNALKTRELLRLMAGWSDDYASSLVIQSIGFDYLWALGRKSGLFRLSWAPLTLEGKASGPGGLFLASDYDGHHWSAKDLFLKGAPAPRKGAPAPIKSKPQDDLTSQGANALSVAILMTMLGQDRLIDDNEHLHTDHEAHYGMWEMLRKLSPLSSNEGRRKSGGESSPIVVGMGWDVKQTPWKTYEMPFPDPETTPLEVSKVGFLKSIREPARCNALLVRVKPNPASVTITAVLVGITRATHEVVWLWNFGTAMAGKLVERHTMP